MDNSNQIKDKFNELVEIMARLRSPDGCPWDKEQTHETLKKYMIEESYELIESIDAADDDAIIEECGDVLLQVIFHARIAQEEGRFTILEILNKICNKLISRHPHVFGDRDARTAEEVLQNWEADKKKEKPERDSILDGIPINLPALMQAHRIQDRVSRIGFDWQQVEEVFEKFEEEWQEFREARSEEHRQRVEEELGDLLFALVNVARYVDVDPEQALAKTNQKFKRRFRYIEREAIRQEQTLDDMTLEEMDRLWDQAKMKEKESKKEIK